MSEPRLISPLLDDFAMGSPISEHQGVRCCPAMRNDSDQKYIVKVISIPASQVRLDALLLSGAYRSNAEALLYFQKLAAEVEQEVGVLKKLSALEGFLPFEGCQVVQMDDGVGFDVYLISPYKRSLAKYFQRHTMTHLNAVNLGLDLCAALAVCRRAGYLYIDLKPENVFISEDKEYRIGDLGFLSLSSLKFASLPDKYRSAYTAPEIQDAFSAINTTVDIYAAGLILYQAYNDGHLPFEGQAPAETLPPPAYADYEMAEIILKACAPKPEDRWQDPIEMGQAIVSYMQRNGANDVPIVPPAPTAEQVAEDPNRNAPAEAASGIFAAAAEADLAEQLQLDELKAILGDEETEPAESEEAAQPLDPDDPANLSFMDELVSDETAPTEDMASDITYGELSEDTSGILSQADELIAHETPEPVIPPEKIDVPTPPPIVPEPPETAEEAQEGIAIEAWEADEEGAPADILPLEDEESTVPKAKKPVGKIIGIVAGVVALLVLLAGIVLFYRGYYLQTVKSMSVQGNEDRLTVSIVSDIPDSLLQVVCTDTYGNRKVEPVTGGNASFTGLNANTLYALKLEISGFHKLVGTVDASYTTPEQTNVISFTAISGAEEGTVILQFTVSGKDSSNWKIAYSTEGEEEKITPATGHMATITGLTLGKTYTFRIISDDPLYIVGNETLDYLVAPLVFPENLAIESCTGNSLTAVWTTPTGEAVESWSVRCYNDAGFDQTMEVAGNSATFTDLDTTQAYNVEVIAKGMTAGRRVFVTENSVTVTGSHVEALDPTTLQVSWTYDGPAPTGDWLLLYTIDGNTAQEVIHSGETQVEIHNYIPDATYQFSLQAESGCTVFGGTFSTVTPPADPYSGYLVTTDNMTFRMCKTPEAADWDRFDLQDSDYTSAFSVNSRASFLVRLDRDYNVSYENITTMFVIRDEAGVPVSHETVSKPWVDMWLKYYCELDIPSLPTTPGNYTIAVYFNGAFVHEQTFQIVSE